MFTNLVSLSASGSLNVDAEVDFTLKMGLDLSGSDKAFYLVTGPGSDATHFNASLDANGQNLNFQAALGPFGLSVINGTAHLNGTINVSLNDDGSHRFNLVTFSGGTPTFFDISALTSAVNIDLPTDSGKNSASINLPLFLGTKDNPIPLDFAGITIH